MDEQCQEKKGLKIKKSENTMNPPKTKICTKKHNYPANRKLANRTKESYRAKTEIGRQRQLDNLNIGRYERTRKPGTSYERNKEKCKAYQNQYRKIHKKELSVWAKEYHKKHKEYINQRDRHRYEIHKEEIKEKYRKKYAERILAKEIRIAHREAIKEDKLHTREKRRAYRQTDEWKEKERAKRLPYQKKWRENNKEKFVACQKAWYWKTNKEKILAKAEKRAYKEQQKRDWAIKQAYYEAPPSKRRNNYVVQGEAMRGIGKYRGMCKDNGKWVFGGIYEDENHSYIIVDVTLFCCREIHARTIEVIPETVGQFTGLKDKNGVDVWQGDKTQYGIVVWSEAEYAWAVIPKDDLGQLLYECSSDIEVIGHIHDEEKP